MKKLLTGSRALCVLLALAVVLALSCVTVSATSAPSTIQLGKPENGTVEITADPGDPAKALITCVPDKGYLTASVRLTAKNGTRLEIAGTETDNVYSCAIPAEDASLTVTFRRARVAFDKTELALSFGETFQVTAKLTCTDGDLKTRNDIADKRLVFASTDPSVATIDQTGLLTAHEMGYAKITARSAVGNGVEGFFYVIVDGDKSPVVGTIQLNAHFDEKLLISDMLPGHSFLIFTNTSGRDITIDTRNLYLSKVPTQKLYDAVDSYDGTGFDPVTFYYATDGEFWNDENLEKREAYAEGFFEEYERGELASYTVRPNDVITIGNDGSSLGFLGEFEEVLIRYGRAVDVKRLFTELAFGRINTDRYLYLLAELVTEVLYDSATGYNPFNEYEKGGVCLNKERLSQLKSRDYTGAVACRTKITEVQLMAMIDYVQYGGENLFSMLERNCTSLASGAWNLVTAAKPQYHMTPNRGGITSAFATPMWLRNTILEQGVLLSADTEIEFFSSIEVIKPAKHLGADCEHTFADGKCTACGATDPEYQPKKVTFLNFIPRIIESVLRMFRGMFRWLKA